MSKLSSYFKLMQYVQMLVPLIEAIEGLLGPKAGADKKKAVVAAFTSVLTTVAPLVESNNPAYRQQVEELVDFMVAQLNKYEGLSG